MKSPMNDKEELIKEIEAAPLNDIEYIQICNPSNLYSMELWYPRYIDELQDYGFAHKTKDDNENICISYKSKQEMADYIRNYNTESSYIMVKYTKYKTYN